VPYGAHRRRKNERQETPAAHVCLVLLLAEVTYLRFLPGVVLSESMQNGLTNNAKEGPVRIPIEDVLDLHAFRPKEIASLLEEYLNACRQARIYSVRIIHGKGRGVLKRRVESLLSKLPMVVSFSDAPATAGGWGATVVELNREHE